MSKDILSGLGNDFNKRGMGVIEVSKVVSWSSVEGFCVANALKVLHINLTKISVCSPRLLILKNLTNFLQ